MATSETACAGPALAVLLRFDAVAADDAEEDAVEALAADDEELAAEEDAVEALAEEDEELAAHEDEELAAVDAVEDEEGGSFTTAS